MSFNVNPRLNSNLEFLNIVEVFEKNGFEQFKKENFILMIEVSKLIGFLNKKDEENVNELLFKMRNEFSKFQS